MHIALFGASGRTGQLLIERALADGHTLSALVRDPAKFPLAGKVEVIEGNAFSLSAITRTVTGADAVLSALGARSLGKEDVLERAIPLIIEAMQASGVQRIVALGSAGALDSALDHQAPWRRWLVENLVYKTLLKWPVASQRAQYAALSPSSLDWTMPMPAMLTDGKPRGNFRIDADALPRNGNRIARADVANFMIDQLTSSDWSKRGVYLSY